MKRKLRNQEPVSYWKSMVDVVTVLMMVILLVLMFFLLNFLINKDVNEDEDDYTGYNHGGYDYDYNPHDGEGDVSPTPTPTPTPTPVPDDDGGGGIGDYTEPTVTYNDDPGLDGYDKAAVYAYLVDEETGKKIEVENVVFELYLTGGAKQKLTTHYPVPISYTEFATTPGGWFYLPEKIKEGDYYFRQINEIPGYDFAADAPFIVEEQHDWDDPVIVEIPVGAAKNRIQVQIDDAATNTGLSGVVFNVIANGNVATPDGTIRYNDGNVVDVIQCDETGYGISKEIYVGNYILVPRTLPFGYAAPVAETRVVTLPRKTEAEDMGPLINLKSGKTTVSVTVRDELDPNTYISENSYTLYCDDDPSEMRVFNTSAAGHFDIMDLRKNATYKLVETAVKEGYIPNETVTTFTVDSLGYIENTPLHEVDLDNRMIRIEIATIDRVLKTSLANYHVKITDQNGKEVYSWISDGSTYKINGIETGIYTLEVEDSQDKTIIVVENVKDIQKFSANVITIRSYVVLIFIGLILLLMILALAFFIVNKLRKTRKRGKFGLIKGSFEDRLYKSRVAKKNKKDKEDKNTKEQNK